MKMSYTGIWLSFAQFLMTRIIPSTCGLAVLRKSCRISPSESLKHKKIQDMIFKGIISGIFNENIIFPRNVNSLFDKQST